MAEMLICNHMPSYYDNHQAEKGNVREIEKKKTYKNTVKRLLRLCTSLFCAYMYECFISSV